MYDADPGEAATFEPHYRPYEPEMPKLVPSEPIVRRWVQPEPEPEPIDARYDGCRMTRPYFDWCMQHLSDLVPRRDGLIGPEEQVTPLPPLEIMLGVFGISAKEPDVSW